MVMRSPGDPFHLVAARDQGHPTVQDLECRLPGVLVLVQAASRRARR